MEQEITKDVQEKLDKFGVETVIFCYTESLIRKKNSCVNNSSSIICMQMCDFSLHFHLPLQNLGEIVEFRIVHILAGCLIVLRSDVVGDVLVIVLCRT